MFGFEKHLGCPKILGICTVYLQGAGESASKIWFRDWENREGHLRACFEKKHCQVTASILE
jgi:hypothetical protein